MILPPFAKTFNVSAREYVETMRDFPECDVYGLLPPEYEEKLYEVRFEPHGHLYLPCDEWQTDDVATHEHQIRCDFRGTGFVHFMPMPDTLLDKYGIFEPDPLFGEHFVKAQFAHNSEYAFNFLSVGYGFLHDFISEREELSFRTTLSRYNRKGDAKYTCVAHPKNTDSYGINHRKYYGVFRYQ